MVITKWFSINTYDNVRHSAVKFLYAEGFAGYYRDRLLKETSPNRLLLTPKNSLTMKQYRSSTNNSDGILSVSFSVQPPFILRSTSVQPPFELRSSSVRAPFGNRRTIEDRSKIDRRTNGESSEARRRCIEALMGSQGKGKPNKKTPKIPHKPHAPDSQKKTLKKLSTRKTLKINTLPKIAKNFFKKTSQNIWSLLENAVPLHSQIRNNAYHANKIAKCKCLKMSCEIDL